MQVAGAGIIVRLGSQPATPPRSHYFAKTCRVTWLALLREANFLELSGAGLCLLSISVRKQSSPISPAPDTRAVNRQSCSRLQSSSIPARTCAASFISQAIFPAPTIACVRNIQFLSWSPISPRSVLERARASLIEGLCSGFYQAVQANSRKQELEVLVVPTPRRRTRKSSPSRSKRQPPPHNTRPPLRASLCGSATPVCFLGFSKRSIFRPNGAAASRAATVKANPSTRS